MASLTKERIIYADVLRIIATFSIVLFHVATDRWYSSFPEKMDWNIINFFVAILRSAVPLFFMLSGINFLDPDKAITTKKIYTKYLPHLFFALVFWVIAYKTTTVSYNYFTGSKPVGIEDITNTIKAIFFEGNTQFHLWFLYDLIGIYILVPVLRIFTKYGKKRDLTYLFILYLIFSFILPFIQEIFHFSFKFNIPDLACYTGYFFAGYYLSRYHISKYLRIILYISAILMAFITVYVNARISYSVGYPDFNFMFQLESLNNAIFATAALVFVKYNIHRLSFLNNPKNIRYLMKISSYCFGIYLSHILFLNILNLLGFSHFTSYPILTLPLISLLIFGLGSLLTIIIKKIPILGKWIV